MSSGHFIRRENCPACGSQMSHKLYSCRFSQPPIRQFLQSFYFGRVEFDYLKGAEFNLQECNNCGTIYQREIPNDFLMSKLYEEWIDPIETFKSHQIKDDLNLFCAYAEEIILMISHFNSCSSQIKVLDFGMGWGKWCCMAKAFGCDTWGTELSKVKIEYAKKNGIKVIAWKEISEHKFDFINAEQVFEHIPNPLNTLRYLKASLKPRGIIKISVPNGRRIKGKLNVNDWMAPKNSKNSLNPVSPLEHINCYTRLSVIKMADIAGLQRIRLPMSMEITCSVNYYKPQDIFKNFLRPLYRKYRNFFAIYLFFRLKE